MTKRKSTLDRLVFYIGLCIASSSFPYYLFTESLLAIPILLLGIGFMVLSLQVKLDLLRAGYK